MPHRDQVNIPCEILRTAVTLEALGSLAKTAAQLGLSQPTISMQVKRLNAMVGGPVFEKGSRSAAVTPLGKLVLEHARRFLKANDQILALGGATAKKLPLRLGLPSLYARNFLEAWGQGGGEDVSITAAYSSATYAAFIEGNLDVACLTGPVGDLGAPVMAWQENLAWVRARDFVVSIGKPIPIVALPGSGSDQPMIAALDKSALSYRVAFASSDKDARYAAVRARYGITVLPERFVPDYLTVATEYYLPKLPPVPISIFVSPDCDTKRSAALLRTLRTLAPPAAQPAPKQTGHVPALKSYRSGRAAS